MDKRKNDSAAEGSEKEEFVSEISSQEQELAEGFADYSIFYDQDTNQKDFKDKQLKNVTIDGQAKKYGVNGYELCQW